jgi:hypothetical protein
MNAQQLEVRALRAENQMLKQTIQTIRHETEKQQTIEKFLAASLTGACVQFDDPTAAAQFALKATDELVRGLDESPRQRRRRRMMAIVLCSIIFSVLAFVGAVFAVIQVEAFKRSTHQVTFIDPAKQAFDSISDEQKKTLSQSFDVAKDIM